MKLHVLGTAGYHPNRNRNTACLMIPEEGILLDAGTGIFRARDLIQTQTLRIFLSHAHLDHIVGLTYLLDVLQGHDVNDVRVYGEPEKLRAVRDCLFSPHLFPVPPTFTDEPVDVGERQEISSGLAFSTCRLQHPGNSMAYRFDWADRSLAYVTDTVANVDAEYVDFIRGVDLLIHECNFPDELSEYAIKTGHSHTTPVAQVAAEANVGRMVLVHFNPLATDPDPIGIDTARNIFANAELAFDGQVIDF